MWIHENDNWPHFTWDAKALTLKLAKLRHHQGLILGRMSALGFELKQEASLNTLTDDVVKSWAIEGESLHPEEVRSSIARRLGIEIAGLIPASRDTEGFVEMMLDATQQFNKPLTQGRLFDWHAALFPTGRSGMHRITVGGWRTQDSGPMQVVSGPIIHFEAPAATRLSEEMTSFLNWFNQNYGEIDPIIKAGIAHLWFISIHPFEDGNGRIARAISDTALAQADNMPERFYSMTSQIEAERTAYYTQLEQQQRGSCDITDWLDWFLNCLSRAISKADSTLDHVFYKSKLWDFINKNSINERQRQIINRMLAPDFKGHMNTGKYATMAKCSNDTALRDIQALKKHRIFIQNPGRGRSTSYRLITQGELG
ncbi:Fic family protein [Marinicella rhabdoformis]|uniref:Fic family protein n=1 Tax=Marinicella rhabdoformis TaxID=2580566 RepID=UPI0012AEB953|nr:Fic family protein [Marinicella rhabdoformis]